MSNVKPGDRAIVIRSDTGHNLSKIVLVVEEYDGKPMEPFDAPYDTRGRGLCWVVESLSSPFVVVGRGRSTRHTPIAVGPDAHLRRLDPPEDEVIDVPAEDSLPVVEEIQS